MMNDADKHTPQGPRCMMTYADKQDVLAKLNWEGGLDYLNGGSSFLEHQDYEFRRLVKAFQKASSELSAFLGTWDETDDDDGA